MSTPNRMSPEELRNELRALHEEIAALQQQISAIADGLQHTAAAAETSAEPGSTTVVLIDEIVMTIGEDGQPAYKARGERYRKFGIRIWPEKLPVIYRGDPLQPGVNRINPQSVRVLLNETGQPRKVIGLAGVS